MGQVAVWEVGNFGGVGEGGRGKEGRREMWLCGNLLRKPSRLCLEIYARARPLQTQVQWKPTRFLLEEREQERLSSGACL